MTWRVTFEAQARGESEVETLVFEQDEIVLGRDERYAHLVLREANVSRRHCAFRVVEDGTVRIFDLGSANGLHVDGERVDDEEFEVGAELMTGNHLVRLVKAPEWLEPPAPREYELVAHPRSSGRSVQRVTVRVSSIGDALEVRYAFEGAIDRLAVPTGPLDWRRLWEHTCAELFVGAPRSEAYVEWNFSPTKQSARLAFSGYREQVSFERAYTRTQLERGAGSLVLTVLGSFVPDAAARIGLAAITRDVDGAQSFWALTHASERPDFHHRDGFVAELS